GLLHRPLDNVFPEILRDLHIARSGVLTCHCLALHRAVSYFTAHRAEWFRASRMTARRVSPASIRSSSARTGTEKVVAAARRRDTRRSPPTPAYRRNERSVPSERRTGQFG